MLSIVLVLSMLTPIVGSAQPLPSARPATTDSPTSGAAPQINQGATQSPPTRSPGPGSEFRIVPGPDYRLGPGDLLEVQVVGRVDIARQQVLVDLEGGINVPPLGAVEVGGLTVLEAQRKIADRARGLFRFADVTLAVVTPRIFEVVVTGEVERPETMIVSATRRVHDAILAAGGVTARGSLRRVTVSRKGSERELDLLRFELLGDLTQNPFLEEGMRIQVRPRSASVTLAGAFVRPGEYELGPGQSLRELLELTGGLSQQAAVGEGRLTRVSADGRKETTAIDFRSLASGGDVRLEAADSLFVPSLGVLQDVVELRGAFNGTAESTKTTTAGKPTIVQRLELARGERIRDAIQKGGGAAAYADLRLAFVERGRTTGPRQRIPVDLERLLVVKDETQNIQLENGDVLTVPVMEDRVYVVGEVKTPGPVDFRQELTAREYVTMAGGPTNRAKLRETTVTFRSGRTYALNEAPPLEPGAVVTVPEVAVKWWQDYVLIAQTIASLITAYTGIFILFNGPLGANH